jgi:hypothetical protein
MDLQVRPWHRDDIPGIVRYWSTLSGEDAARMGCDLRRIPPAAAYASLLEAQLDMPLEKVGSFYSMWLADGLEVGFSSLKNIQFGVRGEMHLHIWDESQRGKGIGARLFCLSALDFYETFRVDTIVCEPSASNPLPNRMLQKAGFPLIGSRFGRSSEISMELQINTYAITRDAARSYLRDV